jgi:hypothetical protein
VQSFAHFKSRRSLAARDYPRVQPRELSLGLRNCDEAVCPRKQSKFANVGRTPLNSALQRLAEGLGKEGRLRTLRFETPRPEAREPTKLYSAGEQPKRWVLMTSSILNFLDLQLATSGATLHLDLANCFRGQYAANTAHYCLSVAKRIRLPRICPDCFAGQDASSRRHEDGSCGIASKNPGDLRKRLR